MTSKQELEKLIESILEQGKVVTVNPDLILNVNVENFIPIIERACEELDRIEELKKDIVTTYESNKLLREENAKLKKVIEILEEEPAILKFPFEDWEYDEEQNLYYCITEIYEYSCDYGDYFWETVKYIYSEENFKLLKEVLKND